MDKQGYGIIAALMLCATSYGFTVIEDGDTPGVYATNINEVVVLAQQNESDITTLDSAYVAADTVVSNAFVAADVVVTAGYVAADIVVFDDLTTDYADADTVVSNALQVQIDSIDGVTESELTAVSNAFVSADTVVSNAFVAADIVVFDDLTAAYIAADTVVSNALAGGSASVTYPVSPADLVFAYTFDGTLTNDWWGGLTTTNTGVDVAFDETRGNYCDLAGSGDNLQGPDASVTIGDNFTMFGWQYFTAAGFGNGYIASIGGDLTDGVSIRFYDSGTGNARARIGEASTFIDLQGADKTTPGWYSVALTYDSGASPSAILYVNGAQEDTDSITAPSFTDGFYIGASNTGSGGDHDVDDVYLWSRTFTSNEVLRLHDLEVNGQYGVQGLRKP